MRRLVDTLSQLLLWTFRDFLREPAALFWTLGFPIIMTLTLGQMTTHAHELNASVAVLASAGDTLKAETWAARAPDQGHIHWTVMPPQALPKALATGAVRLGLENAWEPGVRHWRFDPADQQALLAYHQLRDALEARPKDTLPLQVPGTRYVDFLLPGLLALGLVNSCLWGIGWNLIEMREKRLLRLMLATPLRPEVFFASLFLGRLILAVAETGVLLAFCVFVFHVQIQGSLGALLGLWVCALCGFFGLGMLVGSRTDRASIGQGLINAVTLPVFLISGVFFSLDNFPTWLVGIFHCFPPTQLVDATRAVINAGAGWSEVAVPCLALLGMGVACYLPARRWFKFY
jgi:ABC-type multidrug transport system permease subunit